MFAVEVYAAVRQFVSIDGHSRREAARVFGLNRETIAKMCRFSLPPGSTRTKPINPAMQAQLSPLGWDRINLTGDYVWSDRLDLDDEGFIPLLAKPYRESMSR